MRGTDEQLDRLRRDEEFLRLRARGGLVAEKFGVFDAHVAEAFDAALARYEQQALEQLRS